MGCRLLIPRILDSGRLALPWDPDCAWCDGTGLSACAYSHKRSEPCPFCEPTYIPKAVYTDADADGWLDSVKIDPAKYAQRAGSLQRKDVIAVVVHSMGLTGERASDYVMHLRDGREVSWHYTVHQPGFRRRITQHVPNTRRAWHAGRRFNGISVGIELVHPDTHSYYPDRQIIAAVELVTALQVEFPNLRALVAHHAISPNRRSDPGRKFPWMLFEGMGLDLVPTRDEWAPYLPLHLS